ncbi:MAG: ABC transporter ATP-binding protein, partial [Fenollaria timonensis]
KRIVDFLENFNAGMTGIERFIEIMDTDVDIFDKEDAIELKDVKGKIEFKDVSFTYPDDKNKVLSNVNLVVNDGASIAIVGPSGSGKTTLVNLIPRFYDVTSGEILIDGRNIKDFTLKSLRQNIGSVQQEVYLFSGTILENIKYGKIDASKDEIIEAAKLAGAYDFIMELKDGFNTYVGERGVKLSGGQKQRIAIARVFLKNPKVLILDEATSALDNTSERLIQESLEKLSEGRTTLTIAHRLSTIKNAKTIIVLTDDGIKETGTHDELMSKKGLYYELYTGSLLDLK